MMSSSPQLFTLLTDFGLADTYVAQMKAVLLRGCGLAARIVDITHEVPAHDIAVASFQLFETVRQFPPGAIHIAVVDPGVGGSRRRIIAQLRAPERSFVVAPDNGLLSTLLGEEMLRAAWEISALELLSERRARSTTFDGRDVFAPAAVFLGCGREPGELGRSLELGELVTRPAAFIRRWAGEPITGTIVRFDRFGNAVTNLRVEGAAPPALRVAGRTVALVKSYGDIKQLGALVGSSGFLELSAREASSREVVALNVGDTVEVLAES